MTTSTPADLAVAFRSLHRRLGQAPSEETPPDAVTRAGDAVQAAITNAAVQLGSAATAEGVAAAIDHRHLSDWQQSDLDALQREALAAAKAIRDLENASGR
jgi:hypothetical protein